MTDVEHLALAARVAGVDLADVVAPREDEVVVDGLRLHYVDWGAPGQSALPLLFLHGGGLTCRTWDLVCLGLREEYHCRALDLRGHGDSDWSPTADYAVSAIAADVAGVVDAFGWPRFGLIGMSLGGITALTYAASNWHKLAAMVIVDSGPGNGQPRSHNRVRDFMAGPGELDSVEAFVERALEFNPRRDPRLLRRSLLNNLRQTPSGTWAWKYDRAGLLRRDGNEMQQARFALWSSIPTMQVPTLVVRGARSDMFSDEDAEQLSSTLPDGRWVRVENAGHTVQGDNPRGLLEVLRPFLSDVVR
jgi:pimeloyl-ACP methyl ester carboxylesterase